MLVKGNDNKGTKKTTLKSLNISTLKTQNQNSPLTLGKGKGFFYKGTSSAAFTLIERIVTPSGVIIANHKRAGKVKTGSVGS